MQERKQDLRCFYIVQRVQNLYQVYLGNHSKSHTCPYTFHLPRATEPVLHSRADMQQLGSPNRDDFSHQCKERMMETVTESMRRC